MKNELENKVFIIQIKKEEAILTSIIKRATFSISKLDKTHFAPSKLISKFVRINHQIINK